MTEADAGPATTAVAATARAVETQKRDFTKTTYLRAWGEVQQPCVPFPQIGGIGVNQHVWVAKAVSNRMEKPAKISA